MSPREVSDAICAATGAEGVACVGSKFVIYRFSEKKQAQRNMTGRAKRRETPVSKSDPVRKGIRARRHAAKLEREQRNAFFKEKAVEKAKEMKLPYWCGMIFSSEYFSSYNALGPDEWKSFARMGALVQDMETHALYCNAMYTGKRALSILTMTDNVVTGKSFRAEERMEGNRPMIELALETAYSDWRERQ